MRVAALLTLLGAPLAAQEIAVAPLPPGSVSRDEGLAAMARIHEVLTSPRCANCHVDDGNLPMWSGPSYGPEPRPHGMNVTAGDSRMGAETLPCATCHMADNSPLPHGPPGAPGWRLAPVEMLWFDQSIAEVCAQIGDPDRNGDRSVLQVAEHVAEDDLVHWGWAPGPGRDPAPYSAEELVSFLLRWDAAGGPCPAG